MYHVVHICAFGAFEVSNEPSTSDISLNSPCQKTFDVVEYSAQGPRYSCFILNLVLQMESLESRTRESASREAVRELDQLNLGKSKMAASVLNRLHL